MKLASAIEGGLAGATTISLLGETLRKINGQTSGVNVFDGKSLKKRFKKAKSNKKGESTKEFIQLAGDLLGSTTFLGLTSLGKRKNALLRGALLGAAAGLGSVLLKEKDNKKHEKHGPDGRPTSSLAKDPLLAKAIEVGLYTAGGMIAAKLIQKASTRKKRKKK
jgi:hypothetical protein